MNVTEFAQPHELTHSPVVATVDRLLSIGILLRLPDGQQGLVRTREISWDDTIQREWRTLFKPGQEIKAVHLGKRDGDLAELSVRLAARDPWQDIAERYPAGIVVRGTVTGVQDSGVFVELEPGVVGALRSPHLPAWANKPLPDLFWLGDQIRVIIFKTHASDRRIELSLLEIRSQRWKEEAALEDSLQGVAAKERMMPGRGVFEDETKWQRLYQQRQRILVVEDDASQRESVASWLRNLGQDALSSESAEDALRLIEHGMTGIPDLVLTDVGLPGMSGIELADKLAIQYPELPVAYMSDWARALDAHAKTETSIGEARTLLIKPLLQQDLIDCLLNVTALAGKQAEIDPTEELLSNPERDHLPQTAPATNGKEAINALLQKVYRDTGASHVILFALDRGQTQIKVMADYGDLVIDKKAIANLIHSPVRNVAEGGRTANFEFADGGEASVRHLKPLLNFLSCMGVAVECSATLRYTLFIFHTRPGAFTKVHEQLAKAIAMMIGVVLDRSELMSKTVDIQRQALMGNLSRALVHEVSHYLTPVSMRISNLQRRQHLDDSMGMAKPSILLHEASTTRSEITEINKSLNELIKTIHLFSRFVIPSREKVCNLLEVAQNVADLVRDSADRDKVTVTIEPPLFKPRAWAHETNLQQVLINLTLNAIQHINILRPKEGGRVNTWFDQQLRGGIDFVRIHVVDDGPGIHQNVWERIFDLGYTTREAVGSGLGLFVCKQLVDSMQGRLYVRSSYMLWGSHFILEMPMSSGQNTLRN